MPTIQGTDDFDHGFDVPADYDAVFGTPVSETVSPLYQDRPASLEIVTTGSNIGVRKNYSGGPTRMWSGFALQRVGATSDAVVLGHFATSSSTTARLFLDTNSKLRAVVNGNVNADGPILTSAEWYWVEAITNVVGTTHNLFYRVNEVDEPTASAGGLSASTGTYNQMVSVSGNAAGQTYYVAYWNWGSAAADDDWLGEPEVLAVLDFPPIIYGRGAA